MSRQRLDELNERLEKGTHITGGLGLPICQEIVKMMGGRIHLRSEVGKGTIFWVIIPCKS